MPGGACNTLEAGLCSHSASLRSGSEEGKPRQRAACSAMEGGGGLRSLPRKAGSEHRQSGLDMVSLWTRSWEQAPVHTMGLTPE